MRRVTIIAEIGENHIGNLELARRMIVEAGRAGANVVKFQSYRASDVRQDDPEKDWFAKVELSDEAHFALKQWAEKNGVEFLSSPFTLERARFLCETLGLRKIKIASSEMLNFALLDYVNTHADTVFLSTGMATMEEISRAVARLNRAECCVMHCVTQYPAKPEEVNLRAISSLRSTFPGLATGYSDHTIGVDACIAAVALGASVLEKHFTLDKNCPEGTDHVLSATPDELRELVQRVRNLELMLGDGAKLPSPGERKIVDFVRNRFPKGV